MLYFLELVIKQQVLNRIMSFHLLNKIDKNNIDDEVANLAITEINM